MAQQLRRAVPRQPADWFGFYRFDNSDIDSWRCCRIIDISPLGAGLELYDTVEGEDMDGPITVSLELRGETKSLVLNDEGHTARLGITFPVPTEAAKEYVRTLNGIRSRW